MDEEAILLMVQLLHDMEKVSASRKLTTRDVIRAEKCLKSIGRRIGLLPRFEVVIDQKTNTLNFFPRNGQAARMLKRVEQAIIKHELAKG